MRVQLTPHQSSVGTEAKFFGNFTQAKYLRSQTAQELERRIGYGPRRLAEGWWLLFALEKPDPLHFEFGGYTYFSGARIGDPRLGAARETVDASLKEDLGGDAHLLEVKKRHIEGMTLVGYDRLAKVIPVAAGSEYPIGSGIYQCNVKESGAIKCRVAAFLAPGAIYTGNYV
jgi:hypothetical protein